MSKQITFEFDHEYAGDLASLGIEYQSVEGFDHIIQCTVGYNNPHFAWLDDNCDAWS